MKLLQKNPALLSAYTGLPGSIYILFIARIINAAGNFVYPFLTFFLSNKLGMKADQVGWFVMLVTLVQFPGVIFGGKLADHIGRKKVLVGSQLIAAVFLIVCALMQDLRTIPWLLTWASVFRGAAQPVNSALVADLSDSRNRREAFSLIYLGANIGCAIGPMIAGFLFTHYLRWIFLTDAATTIIASTLVLFLVKEQPVYCQQSAKQDLMHPDERAESGRFWEVMLRRPTLTAMIILLTAYSFVYSQHSFTLPLQLNAVFGAGGPAVFGTLMTTNALVVVCCTAAVIWATRLLKPVHCVTLSGLFYALGFGSYYFISGLPWFILATVIWTIGEILSVTSVGVYIACHAPISHRARFNSLHTFCQGAGVCLSPPLVGQYLASFGIKAVWALIFGCALAATSLMFGVGLLEQKESRRTGRSALEYDTLE